MKYRVLQPFVSPLQGAYHKVGDEIVVPDFQINVFEASLVQHGFIEKIKDEPWKPKEWDDYYIISEYGGVTTDTWHNIQKDTDHQAIGNFFQTKEQAAKARDWLEAFKALRDDTKGFKPDWRDKEQPKWQVYFDIYCGDGGRLGELQAKDERFYHDSIIYFATETDAKESIKKHRKEWYTYFNIEEN